MYLWNAQATIADRRPCMTIKLCNSCRHKGLALLQSSADCLQEKGTSVGVDARLQGTYEQPSTGIAIRWHTNSVIPIAKGAKTCSNTNTSIVVPHNTQPSTSFGPNQVQPIADHAVTNASQQM